VVSRKNAHQRFNRKEKTMRTNVYQITSSKSLQKYIGITTKKLKYRFSTHKNRPNAKLAAAFEQYGKETFSIKLLFICKDIVDANKAEAFLTKAFGTTEFGWNIRPGGSNHLAQETRDKISATLKANYANGAEPWNKGLVGEQKAWNKGLAGTYHTGHVVSDEEKAKLSQRMTGNTNGKKLKGRIFKPETLAKMAAAKLGKAGNRKKGSVTSEETKKKQSLSKLAYFARKQG
jgi:hypothetical protein